METMVAMEDMEGFTTDHMAASEDALLEHSVILACFHKVSHKVHM